MQLSSTLCTTFGIMAHANYIWEKLYPHTQANEQTRPEKLKLIGRLTKRSLTTLQCVNDNFDNNKLEKELKGCNKLLEAHQEPVNNNSAHRFIA